MKRTELAYLAGLFDGEGCIRICKQYRRGYKSYVLRCQLLITTEYIPMLFQSLFGGGVYRSDRGGNTKPVYIWVVSSQLAYQFLKAIYPYLKIKKAEAKLGFDLQESMRHVSQYDRLTDEELAIREAQFITMKAYKNRQRSKKPGP